MCIAPIIIILLLGLEKKAEKKETARQKSKKAKIKDGAHHVDTPPLRNADKVKKEKILLSANVKDFCVMYRRIRSVNELVVNGKVYDEMNFPIICLQTSAVIPLKPVIRIPPTVIFVSTVKQLPRRNAYFEPISAPKRLAVEPYPCSCPFLMTESVMI